MALFQLILLLSTLIYGLASPSLGTKVVLPGLVMTATFAVLIWLTLHRPWDWSFGPGDGSAVPFHGWIWDPGLIIGISLYLANIHRALFRNAKVQLQEWQDASLPDRIFLVDQMRAWEADRWGAILLDGPSQITMFMLPIAMLGILWFFLPR